MSSSEAYATATRLSNFSSRITDLLGTLESAKSAVNQDQLGQIPDAITANIDEQISLLNSASSSFALASSEAKKIADALYQQEQEELRRIEEEAQRRREAAKKRVTGTKNALNGSLKNERRNNLSEI